MKLYILLVLMATASVFAGVITPELETEMAYATDGELLRVLIRPVGRADLDFIENASRGLDRDSRREIASDVMKDFAEYSQSRIISQLESFSSENVFDIHPFWIANAVAVSASPAVIREIAEREDVLYVRFMSPNDILIEPVDIVNPAPPVDGNAWGVDKIGAPDVWAMGYEGSGIIVSVVDTGVNYNHLDLHNNMWHDTDAGYHYGWDFEDGDGDPMDSYGHGTHCAGSVASDGTAGTVCGVAPSATIMALRVGVSFSDEQDVWDAFQFSIDNDADVISTSLGWPQSQSPQRFEWREIEENVLVAGIIHSIAAGNEGGNTGQPFDIRTPGDCPPPWLHPDQTTTGGLSACVTVGATDSNDNLAYFSSVGYSTWLYDAPWNDYEDTSPAIGLIDPDICGPGVDIVSCNYSNPSGYTTLSGTSMATPHLAGCMALMLEANPYLSPAQIDSLLEVTSLDLGTTGKDNQYGSGRVQIYEAVLGALSVGVENAAGSVPPPGVVLSLTGRNPVSSSVAFNLYTGITGDMNISVYDISGREVATVSSGRIEQGTHSYLWTVPENTGSGIYFLIAANGAGADKIQLTVIR